MLLDHPITFVPDVHGDDRAFRESLQKAGVVREQSGGKLRLRTPGTVVQLGDLLDRGNENLAVLDTVLRLREVTKLKLVMLAGNHDLLMLRSLVDTGDPRILHSWMDMGGYAVLREIAQTRGFFLRRTIRNNFPFDLPVRLMHSWRKKVEEKGLERIDFGRALEEAIQLFLHGKYADIFRGMKLLHDEPESVRAVHAGVNALWAQRGAYQADDLMRSMHEGKNFEPIFQESSLTKIIQMRRKYEPGGALMNEETAGYLERQGIDVVIYGHDRQHLGEQLLESSHGIVLIGADISMSRGFMLSPSHWGYIQIDRQGNVIADSEAGGKQDFGKIEAGKYVPPPWFTFGQPY